MGGRIDCWSDGKPDARIQAFHRFAGRVGGAGTVGRGSHRTVDRKSPLFFISL